MRCRALCAGLLAATSALAVTTEESKDAAWLAGRDIYFTATRSDGSAIRAKAQQDVPLPAGIAACVNCHRRSGLGVAEGSVLSPSITGPSLFRASDIPPIRPAYDDALLARALISGIGAKGDPLSDLMPRYELTADDLVAISRYLRDLGATAPKGVTDTEIVIASVLVPGSPVAEREALETVIPAYVAVKNGGTRRERRRAEASARHPFGIKRVQAYREWKHSFWRLSGDAETWSEQLQKYYAVSPPFALLSGSLGAEAGIVHDFCERMRIACILPMTQLPPAAEQDFYSLYFSAGVRLEAKVIADHLAREHAGATRNILLIRNQDSLGLAAQQELDDRLSGLESSVTLVDYVLSPDKVPTIAEWTGLLTSTDAQSLVLLLSAAQLQNLASPKLDASLIPDRIVTAESYTSWSQVPDAPTIRDRVRHVYPHSLATAGRSQFPRESTWLKTRDIRLPNDVNASQVLLACRVLGMALAKIRTNFSAEFLMENLEHALDNSLPTSLYPRISLGPDQRFLSRGAYLAKLVAADGKIEVASGPWIQP